MKFEIIAAAAIAIAFSMSAYAQDKPTAEAPKADAQNVQTKSKGKPHSHLEDRQGIKPSEQPVKKTAAVDKSKHFHPRDR